MTNHEDEPSVLSNEDSTTLAKILELRGISEEEDGEGGDDDTSAHGSEHGSILPTGIKEQAASFERKTLARAETKAVSWLRYIVFLVLFGTGILVSVFVYIFSRRDEQHDFEAAFSANAERVMDSFHQSVGNQIGAIDALSVSVTSFALKTGSQFPNVQIPFFEISGAVARVLAGGLFILWTPIVTDDQREDYEAFVALNRNATNESYAFETDLRDRQDGRFGLEIVDQLPFPDSNHPLSKNPIYQPFHNQIWNMDTKGEGQPPGTGPYMPVLQVSPTLPFEGRINTNLLKSPLQQISAREMLRSGQASLSILNNLQGNAFAEDTVNRFLSAGQYRHERELFIGDFLSPLHYPVFDNFSKDRKLVGGIASTIYWRLFFDNILPPNVEGVICVLENSKNQSISYRLDGPEVTFLGQGDHHDIAYDSLVQTADVISHVRDQARPATRGYSTAELNPNFISYQLRVYPSNDTRAEYTSNRPVWYTAVVSLIFVFTSLVFIMYDCLVERRQSIVMDRAVKSTAMVSSLFPEQVRDRLMNADAPEKRPTMTPGEGGGKPSDWLTGNNGSSFLEQGEGTNTAQLSPRKVGRPIADRFESTTVLFADIAGFTQWSSDRDAEQVFTLLETLYGAFDAIALRRKVFKVETIGDCYMAVTGVPQVQSDHAIRMVKFAKDCLVKMSELTRELAQTLGADTEDLHMRVGIHSGPVTAGVLRGERARFQLFGDTVNTTSRIETHGEKGQIHLSQSTADELIQAGKSHWLIARKGVISMKGKGEMQTYFLKLVGSHDMSVGDRSSACLSAGESSS